jgi:hypothetical protein
MITYTYEIEETTDESFYNPGHLAKFAVFTDTFRFSEDDESIEDEEFTLKVPIILDDDGNIDETATQEKINLERRSAYRSLLEYRQFIEETETP